MLVSKAHDFGFVHIPKNAGSTIRHQLRPYDDLGGAFYGSRIIEGVGRVNGYHIPLPLLQEHFPDAYAALAGVRSYAISRDPQARFASAMAQRLRDRGLVIDELSAADIEREMATVLAKLETGDFAGDERLTDFVIFAPQADFVFNGSTRVIAEVVPIERLDTLFDAIETRHGLPIERDTVFNPTVSYRLPLLAKPLGHAKDLAQRLLPMRPYMALRDAAIGLLTTKGAPTLEATIEGSGRAAAFVADYYARDLALHREALSA